MADELELAPAPGLRVRWDPASVKAYANGSQEEPAWRLEGSLSPGHSALRVLSAATADGGLLLLAAARPTGAEAHDAELTAAVVIEGTDRQPIDEALVSTEYAADGSIRRLGLELYRPDEDFPIRAAGDATSARSDELAGMSRRLARLRFRLDGREGAAVYEIVEAS